MLRLSLSPQFLEVHPDYLLALDAAGRIIGHNRRAQLLLQEHVAGPLIGTAFERLFNAQLGDLGRFLHYGSMNGWVERLVSPEMAAKVGKCWGLGSDTTKDPGPWEGELRNMWKPTQQEALWFHGGNLHQSRHYSRYLALQLKARMEGLDTPVYGLQEVHHTE